MSVATCFRHIQAVDSMYKKKVEISVQQSTPLAERCTKCDCTIAVSKYRIVPCEENNRNEPHRYVCAIRHHTSPVCRKTLPWSVHHYFSAKRR